MSSVRLRSSQTCWRISVKPSALPYQARLLSIDTITIRGGPQGIRCARSAVGGLLQGCAQSIQSDGRADWENPSNWVLNSVIGRYQPRTGYCPPVFGMCGAETRA